MISTQTLRWRIGITLVVISAAMWGLLLLDLGGISPSHCIVTDPEAIPTDVRGIPICGSQGIERASLASFQAMLAMNPAPSLMLGWGMMLVAMMLPILILPIQYIMETSLRRKRIISTLWFMMGYFAVWMLAGVILIGLSMWVLLLLPGSFLPTIIVVGLVFIWEFSPMKQRCLNRNHRHRALSAFGWPASRDALLYGLEHGFWCVGSCWVLMWLPMLLPYGHDLAMAVVTIFMLGGHLERPKAPTWEIRFQFQLVPFLLDLIPALKRARW